MPLASGLVAITLALGACSSEGVGPDAAELANTWNYFKVPKSSPKRLVESFDRFCRNRKPGLAENEKRLRAAGYVPLSRRRGVHSYVVDDSRPAVGMSDRMCLIHAKSRTGQTNAFQSYVARTFPNARPLDPKTINRRIEQAWLIPGNRIIATERGADSGWYTYSLFLFQAEAP